MDVNKLMDAMRATASPKPVAVEVPKWGVVYVKLPTVAEVDAQAEIKDDGNKRRLARGASRVMCTEDGALIFDETNEEHLKLLEDQPWAILQKVLAAAELKDAPEGNEPRGETS